LAVLRTKKDLVENSGRTRWHDKARVWSYVEADFWQHMHMAPHTVSANLRLACIMDYLLRDCPEYRAMREDVSKMGYDELRRLAIDFQARSVHIVEDEELDEP